MTKTTFMEKYPVFSLHVNKNETNFKNVDEIVKHFMQLIENHPIAKLIALFDHYKHTSSIQDGVVAPEIKDAKNVIFCFGAHLPNAKMTAVRPRSIGICEFENSFEINFLEVPMEKYQAVMAEWVKSAKNK